MSDPLDFGIKAGSPEPQVPSPPKSRKALYAALAGCGCLALLLLTCGGIGGAWTLGKNGAPQLPFAGSAVPKAEVSGWLFRIDDEKDGTTLWLTDLEPRPTRITQGGGGAGNVTVGKSISCNFDRRLPGVENLIIDQRLTIRGQNKGTRQNPELEHCEIVGR
jgi:hypothetical protein